MSTQGSKLNNFCLVVNVHMLYKYKENLSDVRLAQLAPHPWECAQGGGRQYFQLRCALDKRNRPLNFEQALST